MLGDHVLAAGSTTARSRMRSSKPQLETLRRPATAVDRPLAYYAALRAAGDTRAHPRLERLLDHSATDSLETVRQHVPVQAQSPARALQPQSAHNARCSPPRARPATCTRFGDLGGAATLGTAVGALTRDVIIGIAVGAACYAGATKIIKTRFRPAPQPSVRDHSCVPNGVTRSAAVIPCSQLSGQGWRVSASDTAAPPGEDVF